jgi:hypothetical protein
MFQNIEDKIGMGKIGKIQIIISLDDEGIPVLDYVVESWEIHEKDYKHLISDCGFYTLDEVMKDIDRRITQ